VLARIAGDRCAEAAAPDFIAVNGEKQVFLPPLMLDSPRVLEEART
jgi:hypothetical protein